MTKLETIAIMAANLKGCALMAPPRLISDTIDNSLVVKDAIAIYAEAEKQLIERGGIADPAMDPGTIEDIPWSASKDDF
jgi:hypothetical protein